MSNAIVEIQYSGRPAETRQMPLGTWIIGREQGDLVMGDPEVSGRHGQLEISQGSVTYTDLGSTNGSYVGAGSERLAASTPVALQQGDVIRIGGCRITVKSVPPPAQTPAGTMIAGPNMSAAAQPAASRPAAAPMPAPVQPAAPAQPLPPLQPAVPAQVGAPAQAAGPVQPGVPVPGAAPLQGAAPLAGAAPVPAAVAAPLPEAGDPWAKAGFADGMDAGSMSAHSHPDQPVRHSYPLAIRDASIGTAVGLLMRTLPYAMARFGILLAFSIATIVWLIVTFGGAAFLAQKVVLLGYVWALAGIVVFGWAWWFVVRYFLYLLKAGHIAVLTELITKNSIANGEQGMFQYGVSVVKSRFGQINALFALDVLIHGVVRAFNRTLDFIASLLPIPGLSSVVGIINSIIYAATTYIDETMFSYNLARGDDNVWRSSRDGLIYYAQNAKEVLKTGVWIVILDKVLTVVAWVAMLVPAFVITYLLPSSLAGWGGTFAFVIAILFASNIRGAFLKPLFLAMVMVKFHVCTEAQPINETWDERLTTASKKFQEIKDKALGAGEPAPQAQIAAG